MLIPWVWFLKITGGGILFSICLGIIIGCTEDNSMGFFVGMLLTCLALFVMLALNLITW